MICVRVIKSTGVLRDSERGQTPRMWVADYFHGDNDPSTRISWIQNEVYKDALRIIVDGSLGHIRAAHSLVGSEHPDNLNRFGKFDHRTLQLAHDVIAAAWRYHCLITEMPLFFHTDRTTRIANKWLTWLQTEVNVWFDQPNIVRNLIIVLANQNVENGYRAEDLLTKALVQRFWIVPWQDFLLELADKSLPSPEI